MAGYFDDAVTDKIRKFYLKDITPEILADIKVHDWIEGVGDITTISQATFIQEYGHLLISLREKSNTVQVDFSSEKKYRKEDKTTKDVGVKHWEVQLCTCSNKNHRLYVKWFRHLAEKILPKGLYYEIYRWPPLEEEEFGSDIRSICFVRIYCATDLPHRKLWISRIINCGRAKWSNDYDTGYVLHSRDKVNGQSIKMTSRELHKLRELCGEEKFNELENIKLSW